MAEKTISVDTNDTWSFPLRSSLSLDTRTVFLRGEIDEIVAGDVNDALRYFDRKSSDPIKIVINSEGGCVGDGLTITDTVQLIRSPVWTFVEWSASFASILAALGAKGHRYVSKSAIVHLHSVSSGIMGKEMDLESEAKLVRRYRNMTLELLLGNTNLPNFIRRNAFDVMTVIMPEDPKLAKKADRQLLRHWLHVEQHLTATQAKNAGLVDKIMDAKNHRDFWVY